MYPKMARRMTVLTAVLLRTLWVNFGELAQVVLKDLNPDPRRRTLNIIARREITDTVS